MLRILFVHPDPKLSDLYIQRMQDQFQVDSVYDGLSALRQFKTSPPSLIVSEYLLPLLSGVTLLRFVREHPQYSSMPFIFLSSYHDNSEALNGGANEWIDTRSAHPDFLLERIYHNLKQLNRYGVQIY